MSYQAVLVDQYPIDQHLVDPSHWGPEPAHLAEVYLSTPRALVWSNASTDWPLLMVILPMASRLMMMRNPIFSNLVRDWGLHIRFVGVDSQQRFFDFKKLLTDDILRKLVNALQSIHSHSTEQQTNPALDVLFSSLAGGMLNMLEKRRENWPQHLARAPRLEPAVVGSLFDRSSRFADFLRALRKGLQSRTIDADFYSRAIRALDLREEAAERRIASIIQSCLNDTILARLNASPVGLHMGCYNWLAIDPHHVSQRHYALQRMGCFAQFFSDYLLTRKDYSNTQDLTETGLALSDLSAENALYMTKAIDSGQDRQLIEALAQRFAVSPNTLRTLWRVAPNALGTPDTWLLQKILLRLDSTDPKAWPSTPNDWFELRQSAAQ
jgi:hypothetical protein